MVKKGGEGRKVKERRWRNEDEGRQVKGEKR
jgi:hypothetical protein